MAFVSLIAALTFTVGTACNARVAAGATDLLMLSLIQRFLPPDLLQTPVITRTSTEGLQPCVSSKQLICGCAHELILRLHKNGPSF